MQLRCHWELSCALFVVDHDCLRARFSSISTPSSHAIPSKMFALSVRSMDGSCRHLEVEADATLPKIMAQLEQKLPPFHEIRLTTNWGVSNSPKDVVLLSWKVPLKYRSLGGKPRAAGKAFRNHTTDHNGALSIEICTIVPGLHDLHDCARP